MDTPNNEHIAQVFDRLASVCVREAVAASAQSALRFKAKQFERVAAAVRARTVPIHSAESVKDVRGFGKGTLRRIEEILKTGTLAELGAEEAGAGGKDDPEAANTS